MIALRFLDIEADILDSFGQIEIQHFPRRIHALLREHRNDMKWHVFALQHADTGDGFIERAATCSGDAVGIVQMLWSIDTDTNPDIPLS